jgi:deoxyguanosine kinase
MYYRVHDALAENPPQTDCLPSADTEVLMQRIASRDRPYERNMEIDYIDQINHAYDTFLLKTWPEILLAM